MKKKPDRKLVVATLGLLIGAACAMAVGALQARGVSGPPDVHFTDKSLRAGVS